MCQDSNDFILLHTYFAQVSGSPLMIGVGVISSGTGSSMIGSSGSGATV